MKSIKTTISTLVLGLVVFAFPVFAGCGDMTSGSKCLVQTVPTTTSKPSVEKEGTFDFEKELVSFFRGVFGKVFF